MSKKFHRDVWVGLVLLLFCAAVLVNAVQISGQAAYLPVALTVLMAVKNSKYAFLFMFFIFIYYLGFRYITYWIATPIFMLFTQKYLKLKSFKINLLITVLYTILAFIVFVVILHLPIYKIGILGRFFRYL